MPLHPTDSLRHEAIKRGLRELGISFGALARELDVSKTSVVTVSQGHRRSHRIQEAIANKLGTRPEDLFPDRYQRSA
ncbi:DNA-binding protein [Roseobacter denitrificans]|uniref:helix-turn-helix domain-containing protein n=1 Tax=Roseobacter denitrificans TaxID=2434 RepID=UPI000A2F2DD6|nr:helix-turn-helix domain-containing protein [Roseobacter denitrificans]AVL53630.1 DNA-binding protein [Roseobacter denitrificans]